MSGASQYNVSRVWLMLHLRRRSTTVIREGLLLSDEEWMRARRTLGLSPRQAEIVRCILQCKSDKQIARDLGISLATVRTHLGRLYQRHNIGDRLGLILLVLTCLRDGKEVDEPTQEA
jgi:DNA-binding CsgD family transcriptional regulator